MCSTSPTRRIPSACSSIYVILSSLLLERLVLFSPQAQRDMKQLARLNIVKWVEFQVCLTPKPNVLSIILHYLPERGTDKWWGLSARCPIASGVYRLNSKAFTSRQYCFEPCEKVGGGVCFECGRRAWNISTTSLSLIYKCLLASGIVPY